MSQRWIALASVIGFLLGALPGAAGVASDNALPEPWPLSERYPAEVTIATAEQLTTLIEAGVEVEDLSRSTAVPLTLFTAVVNVTPAEAEALTRQGYRIRPIPNEGLRAFRQYGPGTAGLEAWPTYSQYVTRMQNLAAAHPDIVRLFSIGESVQMRDIWMLKITDNPDLDEDEPEVKYTSTIHGDEPVGTEMTIRLAELLADNYGTDPVLSALVNEMEIWLCPLHNPDGYVNGSRYNAHGVNLNRDFPDPITDPNDDPTGREPETRAMMLVGYDNRFVMGANYHGGAQVVNYPWDSFVGYAPDDAIFYDYGVGYAVRNPYIWNGGFPNGVTRGWEWYIIHGGMQDWAYHWRHEHHVTIELSNTKWPPYSQMDSHWDANRDAMLWWMERSLTGARGVVLDAVTGEPLDATVDVVQLGKPVQTDSDAGNYHRLLLPGTYTLAVTSEGYLAQSAPVAVASGAAVVQNFYLQRDALWAVEASGSQVVGEPSAVITHTFAVTNVGLLSDTYSLALEPGEWDATLLETEVGPVDTGETGTARVRVEIPVQPAGSWIVARDTLSLTVTSVSSPAVSVRTSGLTQAMADLDVTMTAGQADQSGVVGQLVTYTVTLTNSGDYTDTYALSLHGNLWPSVIVPTTTLLVAPGDSVDIWVLVTVPLGPLGKVHTVTLRATSGWDPTLLAEQELATTRRARQLYLPLVYRGWQS